MKEFAGFSKRDILNIFYRRIFILKFLLVALPLAVFVACLLSTPIYESSAKLMVTGKRENTTLLQGSKDQGLSSYVNLNVDEMDLNSEMELLTSLDLWTRTVVRIGPDALSAPRTSFYGRMKELVSKWFDTALSLKGDQPNLDGSSPEARRSNEIAEALILDLKVVPFPKSRVLEISFRYPDRDMSQRILATMLDLYIPYHLEVYSTPGAQQFFSELGAKYWEAFEKANSEVSEFKKQWGISYPDRQKGELIALMTQLQDSLLELNSNLSQYRKMLDSLNAGVIPTGQLASTKQRTGENTVIAVIATQLLKAQQKKLQTVEYFTPGSRDSRVADEGVRDLTRRLRDAIAGEVDAIIAKKATLVEGLKANEAQLKTLEEKSEEARKLELAALIAKERYLQCVAKEEDARLEDLKQGDRLVNVSVVARPFTSNKPVFPKTALFVLGGIFLAFPLGFGLILVANFFDHTFNSPKEVETATGLPVLASFGKLHASKSTT